MPDYARAYHRAAQTVFERFRKTAQDEEWFANYREMDAHPVVFLYRHALELYLKTVIVWGEPLHFLRGRRQKQKEQIFEGHDLVRLLPGVKDALGLIDCSTLWTPPAFQSFADIERVVRSANEFPHDAFRYPISKAGRTDSLPDGLSFNVLVFTQKLDGLLDFLERMASELWKKLQNEGKSNLVLGGVQR